METTSGYSSFRFNLPIESSEHFHGNHSKGGEVKGKGKKRKEEATICKGGEVKGGEKEEER